MDFSVSWDSNVLRLFAIYRPPPSSDKKLTTTMFLNDFSTFLEVIPSISQYVVILGDFAIHVDDDKDRMAKLFHEMLDSVGLQQHIEGPKHFSRGHTLDLLISRKSDSKVLQTSVVNGMHSDHDAIMGALEFVRPGPSRTNKFNGGMHSDHDAIMGAVPFYFQRRDSFNARVLCMRTSLKFYVMHKQCTIVVGGSYNYFG